MSKRGDWWSTPGEDTSESVAIREDASDSLAILEDESDSLAIREDDPDAVARRIRKCASSMTGMLAMNTDRHPKRAVSSPPTRGPIPAAMPITEPK